MRRRLAALALLLLPLGACSTMGTPGYGPSTDPSDYEYGDVPLRARLYSDPSGLRVYTNREAYISIFEVAPGQGASLLYPAYGSERSYVSSGSNRIYLTSPRPGSFYYGNTSYGYSNGPYNVPRHYLLIASRRPLNVQRLQNAPGELRRTLGYNTFTSINARQVMNEIADLVLPPENDTDWDSDILTVWPEQRTRLAYGTSYGGYGGGYDGYDGYGGPYWVNVRCPDGRVVVAPLDALGYACQTGGRGGSNGGRQNPPPPRDTTHVQPGDTGVVVPGRHRPEPIGPGTPAEHAAGGRPMVDPRGEGTPELGDGRPRVATEGDAAARPRTEPRLEPRRFQPGAEPGAEPGDREPRVARPGGEGRTAQPRGEQPERPAYEPRSANPRAEPREEPQREQPRYVEPRQAEPAREEPRREQPRAEPRQEPRSEPRREEPRREEPRRESPPPRVERTEPASAPSMSRPVEHKEPPR